MDMVSQGTNAGSGGRRSEIVSVRLDPRLKYLAEIAARKQRRPLSGFIEWAVEQALHKVHIKEGNYVDDPTSVADAESSRKLWDVDEADRTVRLALNYPELLTYDEQLVWKLVRECGFLWRGYYSIPAGEWRWPIAEGNLIWDRLRQHWPTFKKVASGDLSVDSLPKWTEKNPRLVADKSRDLDDETPF